MCFTTKLGQLQGKLYFHQFLLKFSFFAAPVASKGIEDDLSAYIPGKNSKS